MNSHSLGICFCLNILFIVCKKFYVVHTVRNTNNIFIWILVKKVVFCGLQVHIIEQRLRH